MHHSAGHQMDSRCVTTYQSCLATGQQVPSCQAELERCTLPKLTAGQAFVINRSPLVNRRGN